MQSNRNRPRQAVFRPLPGAPTAFVLGAEDEIAVIEPMVRRAGLEPVICAIDPPTLDVESIVLDENLAAQVERSSMAIVCADVSGDDRLPLVSFVDESLVEDKLLLVSCTQAGVTEQAAICEHAARLVGFGCLGLLSGKPIVEIAGSMLTDDRMLSAAAEFFSAAQVRVHVVSDTPGLVMARLLVPVVNEAAAALADGVASAEDIDTAVRLGSGFPLGPLHWADEVGIDRVLLAMEYLVQATHEERYRPAPLLRRMAQAGRTGRQVGRGFFDYEDSTERAASTSRINSENSGTPTAP